MTIKIKSLTLYILPRLFASLAIMFAIVYLGFTRPNQEADRIINTHTANIQNLDQSLQNARERLKILDSPAVLKPGKPGARSYASRLEESKGVFSISKFKIPSSLENKKRENRINQFNALMLNKSYINSIVSSMNTLESAQELLIYHSAVMRAVASLLEYDPRKDLSVADQEELYQRLQAAGSGLGRALEKLNDAKNTEYDNSLVQIISLVEQMQSMRQELSESIDKANYPAQKQEFIDFASAIQQKIILIRAAHWEPEKERLIKAADKDQKQLSFYLRVLQTHRLI